MATGPGFYDNLCPQSWQDGSAATFTLQDPHQQSKFSAILLMTDFQRAIALTIKRVLSDNAKALPDLIAVLFLCSLRLPRQLSSSSAFLRCSSKQRARGTQNIWGIAPWIFFVGLGRQR
jgi:hypothetical protein